MSSGKSAGIGCAWRIRRMELDYLIFNSEYMELREFLDLAKRDVCAGENNFYEKYKSIDDGFVECVFVAGDFTYRDRYYGSDIFCGRETVFEKGRPIWAINYYGELLDSKVSSELIYDFLAHALMEGNEKFPNRGPKLFSEGHFIYGNHLSGKLENFMGEEFILFDGKKVYCLRYHGGELK